MACGSLQPFLPLYFTMGRPFPSKLPLPWGDVDSHLIHGSLGPPESSTQMTSQSVQPFCRAHYCDRQTDRLTDHATRSVTIGRIYNNKAIVDHTSPALCTPITPFPVDPICSERVTVHCQWGRKPPKLPLPLGISSPCRRRTEPRHRQHAEKIARQTCSSQ